jgi:hypothetical protein
MLKGLKRSDAYRLDYAANSLPRSAKRLDKKDFLELSRNFAQVVIPVGEDGFLRTDWKSVLRSDSFLRA